MRKQFIAAVVLWLSFCQPILAQSFSPDTVRTDKAQTLTNKVLGTATTFSADILPSSAGARSIGSTALPLLNVVLGNAAGQSAGFDVSALTGNRTITVPDSNTSLPIPSASLSSAGVFDADLDALAGLSTTGILARTAAATYVPRTITLDSGELAGSNLDGVSGNPTIGISDNAVMPGTGSIVVPKGTTAQQPTGVDGDIRYDTTTSKMRVKEGGSWKDMVSSGSFTVFSSSAQTITNAGSLTIAHSLGGTPRFAFAKITCGTADLGYSSGDILMVAVHQDASYGFSIVPDGTNLNIRFGNAGIYVVNKGSGVAGIITNSSWTITFTAIL